MAAYYNEIDPFAAEWLRALIRKGHIAPGDVDERSIEDVTPSDISGYTQCHFFAGIGVWSYALRRAGWPDDKQVWTGSCPCQPFSTAGKRVGFADERHLWPAFFWLIRQCKPRVIFGEQVASKDGLSWWDAVQTDLEATNYASGAVDTCAAGFGAPHIRQRLYWFAHNTESRMAYAHSTGLQGRDTRGPDTERKAVNGFTGRGCSTHTPGPTNGFWRNADWISCKDGRWRAVEPGTFALAHGPAARMGRLRGYGNAINAEQAQAFIEAYIDMEENLYAV